MNKEDIKKILRESIFSLGEAEEQSQGGDDKEVGPKKKKKLDAQAVEIKNNVGPGKPLKYTQTLKAAKIIKSGDSKKEIDTKVSLFRKKILNKKEKIDGSVVTRSLEPNEADSIYKVIKNPTAFKDAA
jgi:hypothetical protein